MCLCYCYQKAQSLDTMKIWPGHISLVAGSCCGICIGLVPLSSGCWQLLSLEKVKKWPQLQLNVLVISPFRGAEYCGLGPLMLCHCRVRRGHGKKPQHSLKPLGFRTVYQSLDHWLHPHSEEPWRYAQLRPHYEAEGGLGWC